MTMLCPKCQGKTKVICSRNKCKFFIKRRRFCRECPFKFYSLEFPAINIDIERYIKRLLTFMMKGKDNNG